MPPVQPKTRVRGSEIGAAAFYFPVAEAGGFGAFRAADFLWHRGGAVGLRAGVLLGGFGFGVVFHGGVLRAVWVRGKEVRKAFFFEKKKQKAFAPLSRDW